MVQVRERILASTVAQGRALLLATVTLPSGEPLLVACVCATTNFKGSIGTGHAGMLAVAAGWEQTGVGVQLLYDWLAHLALNSIYYHVDLLPLNILVSSNRPLLSQSAAVVISCYRH